MRVGWCVSETAPVDGSQILVIELPNFSGEWPRYHVVRGSTSSSIAYGTKRRFVDHAGVERTFDYWQPLPKRTRLTNEHR